MKWILSATVLALCLYGRTAFAAEVDLPIHARIVNLTQMPLPEAIAYCNAHGLACPNIRKKCHD